MSGEAGGRRPRPHRGRVTAVVIGAATFVLAAAAAATVALSSLTPSGDSAGASFGDGTRIQTADHPDLTAEQIADLPEARYDAVIPGLLPYTSTEVPDVAHETYTISADLPIYDDARVPVARFAFQNFASRPTVIVPVRTDGPWMLVLTPARQVLPSHAGGAAPAQTAGWVRADALDRVAALDRRVVVSVGERTLRIEDFAGGVRESFAVGVGAPGTPTPTGVTGYLQERYLDPGQGQAVHRIQLTSLHAAADDEPFQGEDGGLIGMHYFSTYTGSVSHGCIRLSQAAVEAVDALPLGTSVTVVP